MEVQKPHYLARGQSTGFTFILNYNKASPRNQFSLSKQGPYFQKQARNQAILFRYEGLQQNLIKSTKHKLYTVQRLKGEQVLNTTLETPKVNFSRVKEIIVYKILLVVRPSYVQRVQNYSVCYQNNMGTNISKATTAVAKEALQRSHKSLGIPTEEALRQQYQQLCVSQILQQFERWLYQSRESKARLIGEDSEHEGTRNVLIDLYEAWHYVESIGSTLIHKLQAFEWPIDQHDLLPTDKDYKSIIKFQNQKFKELSEQLEDSNSRIIHLSEELKRDRTVSSTEKMGQPCSEMPNCSTSDRKRELSNQAQSKAIEIISNQLAGYAHKIEGCVSYIARDVKYTLEQFEYSMWRMQSKDRKRSRSPDNSGRYPQPEFRLDYCKNPNEYRSMNPNPTTGQYEDRHHRQQSTRKRERQHPQNNPESPNQLPQQSKFVSSHPTNPSNRPS